MPATNWFCMRTYTLPTGEGGVDDGEGDDGEGESGGEGGPVGGVLAGEAEEDGLEGEFVGVLEDGVGHQELVPGLEELEDDDGGDAGSGEGEDDAGEDGELAGAVDAGGFDEFVGEGLEEGAHQEHGEGCGAGDVEDEEPGLVVEESEVF